MMNLFNPLSIGRPVRLVVSTAVLVALPAADLSARTMSADTQPTTKQATEEPVAGRAGGDISRELSDVADAIKEAADPAATNATTAPADTSTTTSRPTTTGPASTRAAGGLPAPAATPVDAARQMDATAADLTPDQVLAAYYYFVTPKQARYARAESEFYVSVNKIVRDVTNKFGEKAGRGIRTLTGDSDDYTNVKVTIEGNSAAVQRDDNPPIPMIRVDGRWKFSIPDWLEILDDEDQQFNQRLSNEHMADGLDEIRTRISNGELKSLEAIEDAVTALSDDEEE